MHEGEGEIRKEKGNVGNLVGVSSFSANKGLCPTQRFFSPTL